ncbi:hypothetical protein [Brevifollis gellanilyticus]|uniref:hypothetical protein n=1 Tax=Brevifollis gellanilyticus TaxID=748831 RepID=UPI001C3F5E2A|nr:hypothetical protein [Brevifollis gellanilyticus]
MILGTEPLATPHKMIFRAVKDGLTLERIATALNLRVKDIRDSLRLLDGIDEEVADMLKDRHQEKEDYWQPREKPRLHLLH